MGIFSNNNDDNNGVEVICTGSELFRLSDSDLGYDGKISAKGDGSFDLYETSSNWEDHSHVHVDENGNKVYDRNEGDGHKWRHRQND